MGKDKVPYQKEKKMIAELRRTNTKKALAACRAFRRKAMAEGDEEQVAVAEYCYAECVFYAEDYQKAIEYFTKSLYLFHKYNRTDLLENAHNLIGISYTILGDSQKALAQYLLSMDYCKDGKSKLITQTNIGVLYFDLESYEESFKYFQKVYDKTIKYYNFKTGEYSPNRPKIMPIIALLNMADVLCVLERHDEAQFYLDQIEEYVRVFKDKAEGLEDNWVLVKCCQARNAFGKGDLKAALEYTNELIEILKTAKFDQDSIVDSEKLIPLLVKYGFLKEARILLDNVYDRVSKLDTTSQWVGYYGCCIDYYKAEQNIAKLIDAYDNYFYYGKKKESENNQKFVRDIQTKLSLEKALTKQRQSEEREKRLKLLSETDALTGALNRFSMNKMLDTLFTKAKDIQTTFGAMLFDVDCFKEYNDTYGHVAGDECLKAVAKVLNSFTDENHFVARYGGDEFLLMTIGQSNEKMRQTANAIRDAVMALKLEHKNSKTDEKIVTLTIGVSNHIPGVEQTVLDELLLTDEALYDAKRTKRGTAAFHFAEE